MARTDPHSEAMGAAVRGALAQAGLTQQVAAERIEMSVNALRRRINGELSFTFAELVRISQITNVTVTELTTTADRLAS